VSDTPTREQLEAAHCWEADDVIARRPAMTAFRQRMRYEQARWREARGYPIGSQPHVPRPGGPQPRPLGSRLPLAYAQETGANLVTRAALAAARTRTSATEPRQSFDYQRLWADLLSSEALAFNLFGDLAADHQLANRAVHAWWPDAPGRVSDVRFAHSPGRLDPAWLNSLREFDVAFGLEKPEGALGIVAVDVKLHERLKPETPKPENLWRTVAVAERSGVFAPGAIDSVKGRSELAVLWLEHLLMLSMLQHVSGQWTWGRYVIVHPAGNPDMVEACARYRSLLADESTFGSITIEELIDSAVLPAPTITKLRERYPAA
jgi:hypothetical protein